MYVISTDVEIVYSVPALANRESIKNQSSKFLPVDQGAVD